MARTKQTARDAAGGKSSSKTIATKGSSKGKGAKKKGKTSTFLGLGCNDTRYESNASEGNRFIRDDDL